MAQNIDVNVVPQSHLPEFRVSEGDVGRTMIANILDADGSDFSIPDDSTVTFVGTKPSGLGFTIEGTYSDNVVTFVSEDTMDNEVGRFPCEIRITDEDDNRLGTCNILLIIERDPHPDDTTDGDTETFLNEITAMLEEITEAHETALSEISDAEDEALDAIQDDVDEADAYRLVSEGYAAGTQDGTEVTSGTYYENNAKYYSELAAQSAELSGWAIFSVDEEDGQAYVTVSESIADDVSFAVNTANGTLEVTVNG